jgi:hypothetical protein
MTITQAIILASSFAVLAACSTTGPRAVHVPAAQFRSAVSKPADHHARAKHSGTTLVEESLHARGIRFGTDGSAVALYTFVKSQFAHIAAEQAQAGDVLFFDVGPGCGSHSGIVETTDATGRIGFREWRDGSSRHSFVTPREPFVRRDDRGRILNSFLRPKRPEDALETRHFAGDMLCAAFRIDSR